MLYLRIHKALEQSGPMRSLTGRVLRSYRCRPAHLSYEGPTGFDMIVLREEAGRGLLATLNRGTVKMN